MRVLIVAAIALFVVACKPSVTIVNPAAPTDVSKPAVVEPNRIAFRVTGTASSVRVRYSNPSDGLNQTVTSLPFNASFATNSNTLFLALEATPIVYPTILGPNFLSIQIFANDSLFREAASADSLLNTLTISGTWRK